MKEGWTFTPFEDVCVSMTKGPFGSDIKKSLYVPKSADTYKVYIQVNAIEKDASLGEYFISKEYYNSKMSRFEVKPNDYIITCDGTLGRYLRLPPTMERGIISASLLRITLKTNILPRFFEYLWDGYIMSRLTSDIRNSALVHLPSATKIGKVLIPLPSIAEQEHIVAELDLLQGIIDKQKAQLKELDTLAQSIFYDMFGDPVENDNGWDSLPIGQIGKVITGNTPSTKDENNYSSDDYCFVKPSDIEREGVCNIAITEYHISAKAFENARQLPVGSVLTTCIGIIGKVGVLRIDATCNQQINAVIPDTKRVSSSFLAFCILGLRSILESMANAPVVPIINKGDFSRIAIPLPPLPLQQSFATKIEAIERQKASINASIAETQKLFDYTMDKYFG